MYYSTTTTSPNEQLSDCIVIPVLAGNQLSDIGMLLDKATQGQLSRVVQSDLPCELGKSVIIYEPYQLLCKRILAISCGDQSILTREDFQKILEAIGESMHRPGVQSACCYLNEFPITDTSLTGKICMAVQQFEISAYTFDRFKTKPASAMVLESVCFYHDQAVNAKDIKQALNKGTAIAHGIRITKDLSNTPVNHATPAKVADYATELFKEDPRLQVNIYDKHHATIKEMGGFLGVAQGSDEPPKFVVIQYTPAKALAHKPIVLVGKGVTFDSGGISIKPSAHMGEMKFDMAGAASVLGIVKAVSMQQLPIPLVGLLPLTENLPNGSALKPGDVIKMLSGKTVEILDTDAEGRLILADALTYSRRFEPAVVIDIATLTGAVEVALGSIATGLMTTHTDLQNRLEQAGEVSVDPVWPLPLWNAYQRFIDSNVADISNLGFGGAGSITAGCFLSRFTEGLCWAHLDIAGTAYISGRNKRATGRPVRLLVQYIEDYCRRLNT